jgi:hypothetical protein
MKYNCDYCEDLGYRTVSVENEQGSGDIVQEECERCHGNTQPTNTMLKQAQEKAREKLPCINPSCDGHGNIPHQVSENEWEAEQCQFCYEYRLQPLDDVIKQVYEDVVHEVESMKKWEYDFQGKRSMALKNYNQAIDDILNKLKSDI